MPNSCQRRRAFDTGLDPLRFLVHFFAVLFRHHHVSDQQLCPALIEPEPANALSDSTMIFLLSCIIGDDMITRVKEACGKPETEQLEYGAPNNDRSAEIIEG